ncbi:hypothetical protein ABVT39_018812 [Epinephelus coioides]
MLRTDEAFAQQVYEEHQHGPNPFHGSNVGMVSQFPMDYMHLVCLGVVRKLLLTWLRGSLNVRLPANVVNQMSDHDYMSAWWAMKKSFTCQTSELDTDHGEEEAVQRFKRKRKPIYRFGETDSENDQEEVPQNNQARSRQPSKSKSSETQQSLSCSAPPVPPPYRSSLHESSLSPPPPPVSSPRRSSSLNESVPSLMPPESSPQASSPR